MTHRFRSATVFLTLTVMTAGCTKPSGQAVAPKTIAPVRVKTVSLTTSESRRTTSQPATVHALHTASIRPRVAGYLDQVLVDIGDVVEDGQPLAVIDVPEMKKQAAVLDARVAQRQAMETAARAGVKLASANVEATKAKLEQARSELQSVEASLAAATAEFKRTKDLVDRRSLEARVLDEVRKKRDSELARQAAVTSAVTSASAEVKVAAARQSAAEAELVTAIAETKIATSEREELDVHLGFATLQAPFHGVVTMRHAEPGDLVGSDESQVLFVISQIDRVRVRTAIPERDAAFVNRGDSVALSFPSFPGQEALAASVTRTTSGLDPSTRMMTVEMEMDNPGSRLLPGMFGRAEIELDVIDSMAALPARAVRFTEKGEPYVYVVADGQVSRVDVVTGADTGEVIQIVSGLNPGQSVIDAHLQRFQDGQKVNVLN
ncbi:MAG: efflux RND transporter periplasmic adaptor subunit [Planctomycetaceae bacterium]|nr:efflux RND transporter periplasmic adaptor subunit [Planctomycetaceae bacterium]